MNLLTHTDHISLVLSCFDRMIFCGTLPDITYAQGMTSYMYAHHIKIFDYCRFTEQLKDKLRSHVEKLAEESGIKIEFVNNSNIRKEDFVSDKLKDRGTHPGLICILSAMEGCQTYTPWHDKSTGRTFLKPDRSQCIHYYFYFIDPQLGLCHVRVPTWCPFRFQICANGHNILAKSMESEGISFTMLDNSFDSISDPVRAQALSDEISVETLHRKLDEFAWRFCPLYKELGLRYHWSIMQAEYATDIVFKKQEYLSSLYEQLIATAIHTVKPDNIATFLGRKLDPKYQGQAGNNYNIRIEGSRIKHSMGVNSIKMYDKFNKILRIETTTNDVSFFKHYREVVHRDGKKSCRNASLKKNIYSLGFLSEILKGCNNRYLEFISAFDNKILGRKRLEQVSQSKQVENRNYRGFNFFDREDVAVLLAILRGEFNINGFRNKHLSGILKMSTAKASRLIKRLRVHGLIKKVSKCYKYYVTRLGKQAIIMAQKIKEGLLVPAFNF